MLQVVREREKDDHNRVFGDFFGLKVDEPNTRPDLPICGNFTLAHKADH